MIVDMGFVLDGSDDVEPVRAGNSHFETIPGVTNESYR